MSSRRQFIFGCWVFVALMIAASAAGVVPDNASGADKDAAAGKSRPNFVFLYTDDQRWDALGVVQREQGKGGRFPWLESPRLDQLAAQGVRFRNAFVVTALCAPSRAAFLTGQYGHVNGVVNNHTPFSETAVTHASLMRGAGYRTGYVGKWHMGSQSGQRPGFDYSASFIGQGVYFDCPVEVNGEKTATRGWIDDVSTDYAIRFIEENKSRPFSLVVGFKTCHGPFTPPPRTAETYGEARARIVPNLSTPAIYRDAASPVTAPAKKKKKASLPAEPAPPAAGLDDGVPTNLGMFRGLRAIDENVGRLLDTLERLGLTENTVVAYSSDNGYYLGEHGLGDKRTAYDESMRIPLLVRYPKLVAAGLTIDDLVLNIDLAPTWLDLAGVSIPETMQGRSWRPLLVGERPEPAWRESFFYSYFREGRFAAPTVTAVRTGRAKLIKYPGRDDWTELFDLSTDPYETRNLFGDATRADLRAQLEAEYARQSAAARYEVPAFADERQESARAKERRAKPVSGWVLDLSADRWEGQRALDASSHANHGVTRDVAKVKGRDERFAFQFAGNSVIEVNNSPSLDPSDTPWLVEATLRADSDGVIVARGGQTLGYSLLIRDGKPTFAYRAGPGVRTIAGSESILGRWVTVTGSIDAEKRLTLTVDGQVVASGTAVEWIHKDPNDKMEIGADHRSTVVENSPAKFRGLIERVRVRSGSSP